MSFISVILCTHNPKPCYLSRTLEALRQQSLPLSEWELVLVDNRSDVPLADILDLTWHGSATVIREEKLGLTPARLRGIRQARGELFVFVDDDNLLDPDFLETALRVAHEKSFLGSWSGQCRPAFEKDPPEWTRRYWGNLVIRQFDEDRWSNLARSPDTMPCGAGLCVRRNAAMHYLRLNDSGQRGFQFDRTGNSLVSGGDNDLAACACDLGLGVGLISGLRLTHLIPPDRLTADYLARLAEGIHFSAVLLDGIYSAPQAVEKWRVRIRDWVKASLRFQPHRRIQRSVLRGRNRGVCWLQQNAPKNQI
jgi:glycosyltransferase involved in cell wall biosynthesis